VDGRLISRRSRRVTIFTLLVLLLGSGVNLARAAWTLAQADALAVLSLSTSMPMSYLFGISLAWCLVFGLCSFGLWRLRSWGRTVTLVSVTLYHGHVWFNHILFDRSDYARQVWPFAIAHTAVVLSLVWGFLNWPSMRQVFEEPDGPAPLGVEK
jgi:hypothetical protein